MRTRLADAAIVGACCLLFFFISTYQLDLPGLYTDEAYDVIPAMQIVLGNPVELQGDVLRLGGLILPLMSSSAYQGVTYTYLAIPFFALGGVNVFSLRTMTVLVGVVGVILAYFLGKAWFGRRAGLLAALMLALSPSWIFWSRVGVYVVSVVAPVAAGALLAFTHWVRKRPLGARNGALYLGMFLMGIGLSTKLLFLWFIVAVGLTALILWGRALWESRRTWLRDWARWLHVTAFGALAFALGAAPFLLYNLLTRGTFHLIRETLRNPTATTHGVDNTAFIRNLWTEADAFKVLLDGGYFWFQGSNGQPHSNPLMPTLFALSAAGLLALVLARRGGLRARLGRFSMVSVALLGAGLFLSTLLAAGLLGTPVQSWTAAPALAAIVFGVVMSVVAGAREGAGSLVTVAWALFAVTLLSGALWWVGGAGRPEGTAPGAFLGLWPVDPAGILFWVGGAGLVMLLGLDPRPAHHQRATVALLALIGLLVAQSTVTVSGLWSTHLVIVMPLPQIVIGAFAVALTRWVSERLPSGLGRAREALRVLPAVLLLVPALLLEAAVVYVYHRDLQHGGGATTFSSAIYDLNDYLTMEHAGRRVVAMDWGFRRPLQLISNERIVPIEGYGLSAAPPAEFYFSLREWLKDPDTVYIFHTRAATAYPRHEDFLEQARVAGKTAELVRTFYQRDGTAVYEVYMVR